ncbi:MAG: glycoside hydrolase N-terminal domain-containing protein [Clostridia bacterium]|nr:glycoside hydrolase N-terminal domain-containing protein [Clostridia bacterium]
MTNASNTLWYNHPAKTWVHSLLLGNGSLGAALYGRTDTECVELNLDTLWSGYPDRVAPFDGDPYETFKKARELSLEGKNFEAQELIEKKFSSHNSQFYLPLGKLLITSKSGLKPRKYKRQLDLKTAVHKVTYTLGGKCVESEAFVSAPADVFVMKTKSEGILPDYSYTITNVVKHDVTTDGEFLILKGLCPSEITDDGEDVYLDGKKKGMEFCAAVKFVTDGEVKFNKNNVSISGAKEITIILGADDSFKKWNEVPDKEYFEPCKAKVRAAAEVKYETLKAEHIKDYQSLYNRVSLDLGESNKENTVTSSRLLQFLRCKNDIELYTLLFNFGRYLAISASREGSQAMTLQGIWTYKKVSPWRSNYTVNINTEMNYWPLLACNLPELCKPLNSFVEELAESGKETAKRLYGARGFTCHHNVDLWRMTTPVNGCASWLFWNMSGAWFTRHLYEYYEYTGDKEYLRNEAYPVILESAKFCMDILVDDGNGYLIAAPSTSPENKYLDEKGNDVAVSQTTTMTMSIIKDNLQNALNCAEILGDNDPAIDEIKEVLPKLLPFKIGKDGRLLEWYEEKPEEEVKHRHVSHLYGLFPANLIDVERTPELVDAAVKTLKKRGDGGTGWSLGWKINFFARLRDGNHALKLINNQLRYIPNPEVRGRGGTYPNMLDAHPPFQIDGNFGAVSGIAQLFVQSFGNRVLVLPALPDAWKDGSIKGMLVKGGATVNIEWKDGKLSKLTACGKGEFEFVYGGKSVTVTLDGSEKEIGELV